MFTLDICWAVSTAIFWQYETRLEYGIILETFGGIVG
jgi:hypothetical protein